MDAETEEPMPETPLWNHKAVWIAVGLFIIIVVVAALFVLAANSADASAAKELPEMVGGC